MRNNASHLKKFLKLRGIRVPYLQALEADDLSVLPSPVQARGYLRNYAEFLGLDFESILEEMHATSVQASGKIIGPADETVSTPQKNNELPAAQQVMPTFKSWICRVRRRTLMEEPSPSRQDSDALQV